ncbi:MAG: hypothetical protein CVT95_12445, partial [Bacteroidetes bacterium HGW-Bacteroidetes-12]
KLPKNEKKQRFENFVNSFYIKQRQHISSDKSLLNLMKGYWSSFSFFYEDPDKVFTLIKRTKTINEFENILLSTFTK